MCRISSIWQVVELVTRDNRTLHESLKRCKAAYEELATQHANDPAFVEKIAAQLRSIHAAMDESNRAFELVREAPAKRISERMIEEYCTIEYDTATTSSRDSTPICMSVISQGNPHNSVFDDEVNYHAHLHGDVARTTVSGLELLMLYIEAEIRRARAFIREYGIRIRQFFYRGVQIDLRRVARRF
ncbi:unnamed protein product, partial [Strongylus vulgaris]